MSKFANNSARRKGWKQKLGSGTLSKQRRPPMSRQDAEGVLSQLHSGESYASIADALGVDGPPKTTLRAAVNRLRASQGVKHRAVSKAKGVKGASAARHSTPFRVGPQKHRKAA